jgi:uncharacterized protein YfaS (alpha-2-macroglobulin family)
MEMNAVLSLLFTGVLAAAGQPLRVAKAGPEGPIASLAEANEIRVVFSEPMVALGKIPSPVRAPFFHVEPKVSGSFRWSGTTTLIFSPSAALPYATEYSVIIDASATSIAGHRLEKPHRFSFTTPTVRLLRTSWYRRANRHDSSIVVVLRFNQPVSSRAVAAHTTLRYAEHPWEPPTPPATSDPALLADFETRLRAARAAAGRAGAVAFTVAADWDRKKYPPSPDLVVLQTRTIPPTDAWVGVWIGGDVTGLAGRETPGEPQSYTIKLESTLFVAGMQCTEHCDPDSANPISFRTRVPLASLRRTLRVTDVTAAGHEVRLRPQPRGKTEVSEEEMPGEDEDDEYHPSSAYTMDDLGYRLAPARTYRIEVDPTLRSADGQRLLYTWIATVENWHELAFTSFEGGHGVWEASGGPTVPFTARNLKSLTEWLAPVSADRLMPTIRELQPDDFSATPSTAPRSRSLSPVPDRQQAYGLDLRSVLSDKGLGLAWAAIQSGDPIARSARAGRNTPQSTLLQVTNLGISVKDSPANTLVFVTRLDDGRPVSGARVTIRTLDNTVFWSGATDAAGLAMIPGTDLRDHERWYELRFIVTAEKDGDVAYLGSDWNEGLAPWEFGLSLNLDEASPLLRGRVFSDRGVYKLGEEVHFKAILRSDTPDGMVLPSSGEKAQIEVRDSQNQQVDKRTVTLSEWGSADWVWKVPAQGSLGEYRVSASVEGRKRTVEGDFLVAAYRRPDFRVDVNLASESPLAGSRLKGTISARYLFGAPMAGRPVRWAFSRRPSHDVPKAITQRFSDDQWVFLGWDSEGERTEQPEIQRKEDSIGADGTLALDLDTIAAAGVPSEYTLEGEVTDVSRQRIAGRSSFLVHPAPWYVGVKNPPYFASASAGIDTEIVAAALDGKPAAGVKVHVTLTQVQWHSVRRAEGNGFYAWESRREATPAGEWDVVTREDPTPLHLPLSSGGYYVLKARADDTGGRFTTTTVSFYALGAGYTAWERFDHNRIDLVPEKKTYRPGDTARLMIKSPWEKATVLLTTEREGIRSRRTFTLTSTQQTVEVPITDADIPNVFVSVLLVKGRSVAFSTEDSSDPGKPSFRLGYAEIAVEDVRRRLALEVSAEREEYRPAETAKIQVSVKDASGKPDSAEVTLWAVDHGVLSLTGYQTPDLLPSVWVRKGLEVLTEDSRQRIVSRRVLTPKGAEEGGGGGDAEGPGSPVRKDFRVLAFWLGSVVTDAQGRATTQVKLPESLTTYRIMAVAGDKQSRFGRAQTEIRISKPVLLKSAFPRFLAVGDTALFGSVAHSQIKEDGTAIVTMRSLDPGLLEVSGSSRQSVAIKAKSSAEVRFPVKARAPGKARIEMTVKLLGETDAFQEIIPIEILSTPEVVAAYGQARPKASEEVELPAGVIPSFGGLEWELSSTAMVGLGEGARYLLDYPYGCAEQRASSALALLLAADLGDAFRLPGIEPAKLQGTVRSTLAELPDFQRGDGGFGYWKGDGESSPYLTAWVLHVLERAKKLQYEIKAGVMEKGLDYLDRVVGEKPPANEGWWPGYTAWQAFAVKVLAEAGRNEDSNVNRLSGYADRMPVFALSYLADAMEAAGVKDGRLESLRRRIANAVLPEGGTSHVEELADPYLLWFWSSNVRSTAIVLDGLVRSGADETFVSGMVRWLMKVREKGRWGNTQENATAMEALVDYYRKFEREVPDFTAVVSLAGDALDRQKFAGRSTEPRGRAISMADLLGRGKAGQRLGLAFERQGTGTLFYSARLRYASAMPARQGKDQGIRVEREYAPQSETGAPGPAARTFRAGELVKVTLTFRMPKERRFVAVTDPIPAGLEPVESWFATTASELSKQQEAAEDQEGDWTAWWQRGGFDHVERHDDHILLFATRLAEGEHRFSYVTRATTAGTFQAAPAHAEEMYEPEVFGATATDTVEVK